MIPRREDTDRGHGPVKTDKRRGGSGGSQIGKREEWQLRIRTDRRRYGQGTRTEDTDRYRQTNGEAERVEEVKSVSERTGR